MDSEPVREWRVDLQGLAGLGDPLVLGERPQGAHVVEAVGELDQDHPHVGGDRDHHLAVVLRLALVAALEGDPGQLRHPVDELGDLLAELGVDLLQARAGVLDRVVKQRRAQGFGVEPHPGADLRHAHGMGDELVTRLPHLVGVALAGEGEGAGHGLAVDRRRLVLVLADHGEQVAEQAALLVAERPGQLVERSPGGGFRRGAHLGVPAAVIGSLGRRLGAVGRFGAGGRLGAVARLGTARRLRPVGRLGRRLGARRGLCAGALRLRARGCAPLLSLRGGALLHGCLRLARYRWPSSRRAA